VSSVLGLLGFVLYVASIIGVAAGVTWIVVRYTPSKKPSGPPPSGVQFTSQLQQGRKLNKPTTAVQSRDAREYAVEMMGRKQAKMKLNALW